MTGTKSSESPRLPHKELESKQEWHHEWLFIVLLMIFGLFLTNTESSNEQASEQGLDMASTDLLTLLLQLTKASAQLDSICQELGGSANSKRLIKTQELIDSERKRLVGRLRKAGVSELAIQQASSIE